MVQLREVIRLLLHAASPSGALGAKLVDNVDEVDHFDDYLPASRDMVRKPDLALAAGPKDNVRDLELVLELLHVNPVSRFAQSYRC